MDFNSSVRTKVLSIMDPAWRILVLGGICMYFGMPLVGHTSSFDVDGRLHYKVFDPRSNILFRAELNFHVEVDHSRWRITTRPVVTNNMESILFHQVATDGSSITSLSYLNSDAETFMPKGFDLGSPVSVKKSEVKKKPRNKAVAEVYDGNVPRGNHTFASPLWLAYAADTYLESVTNGRMRDIWLDGRKNKTNEMRAEIQTWPAPLTSIRSITYFNEGYVVSETEGGGTSITPLDPPYDKGYKDLQYTVEATTNFGSLRVPWHFRLVKYDRVSHPASASDVRVLAIIDGETSWAAEMPVSRALAVEIPGTTAVFDSRRAGLGAGVPGVSYLVQSNWPSTDKLMVLRSNIGASRGGSKQRHLSKSQRVLLFSIFASLTGLAAYLIFAGGRRRRAQSPQPKR